MSTEHHTVAVTWQCHCGAKQTGFVSVKGGGYTKHRCVSCCQITLQRKMNILQTHPHITFKPNS